MMATVEATPANQKWTSHKGDDEEKTQPQVSSSESTHASGDQSHEGRLRALCSSRCCRSFAKSWPRLHAFTTQVILPLILVVFICFFCGWLMVIVESEQEIVSNDAIIAERFNASVQVHVLAEKVEDTPRYCLETFNDTAFVRESFVMHFDECTEQLAFEAAKLRDDIVDLLWSRDSLANVNFGWTVCNLPRSRRDFESLTKFFAASWIDSFLSLLDIEPVTNTTRDEVLNASRSDGYLYEEALKAATGRNECSHHIAAGTLYWFIVMTTIGYGNVAPVTKTGRRLVFSLGFVSIIVWGAITAEAGSVCLAICDDFFLRWRRLRCLAMGWTAWLFWLCMFYLYIFVLSCIILALEDGILEGDDFGKQEAFWFSFISVTTVGLGDFFLPGHRIYVYDMVYIPFIFLCGFIILANFLLKLSEWLIGLRNATSPTLAHVLRERRDQYEQSVD
jgi:hypothetical protein